MRRHLLVVPILALCAASAWAQDASSSADVLAAIAADAGAPAQPEVPEAPDAPEAPEPPQAPAVLTLTERLAEAPQPAAASPGPAPDATIGEPAVDRANAPLAPSTMAAAADATRGTCNIGHGERWQQQPDLTLEQCAAALAGGNEPYDEHGLRHAHWPGVYLSASRTAIYQSSNGSDWTRLRLSTAD